MQAYPAGNNSPADLTGSTLIVPVVSTGNVGQLAVDLFITSFRFKRVGILDSRYLVPIVGGREDGEEGVTTPLELYGKEGTKVFAVQQRSPVMKSSKGDFVDGLITFIRKSRISTVLFLSGVDLSDRPEAHMDTPTFHLIPTSRTASTPLPSALQELVTHIPPFIMTTHDTSATDLPVIPGSGLTRRIATSLPSTFPATGVILEYVLEGDNRIDAKLLASAVARCVQAELKITGNEEWKEPASWKQGLFGSAHDQTLFG